MSEKRPIYLVTGGAGFLGSHVISQLMERGEKIRAFAHSSKKIPEGIELVQGSITKMADVERFFTVPEGEETVCIHIASKVWMEEYYDQGTYEINVFGTRNIIDACLAHPECKKLVYCGSTSTVPELPMGKKMSEPERYNPEGLVGWYSKTKAIATQDVLDAAKEKGLNACVCHPSGILGPHAAGVVGTYMPWIGKGILPVGAEGTFNCCDVRDLAKTLIDAVEKGKAGESYILANEVLTMPGLFDLILNETGKMKPFYYLPLAPVNALAVLAEKVTKPFPIKNPLTTYIVYNIRRNNDYDSSKAKRELGYTTRPYSETIHDMVEVFKETGKL